MNPVNDAVQIFRAGIRAVQAEHVFSRVDPEAVIGRALGTYRKVALVALGKSALASACVLLERLGTVEEGRPAAAMAAVPRGYVSTLPSHLRVPAALEVFEGGHPTPDWISVRAAERANAIARMMQDDDLLLVAVSGGGTSACNAFPEGISIADAALAFDLLLKSGAGIGAMNAVRKHLSTFNGGRLAEAARPADVVAFLASDVPGDDQSVIAGGPVSPDPTTFADAWDIVQRLQLSDRLPASVRRHLDDGLRGDVADTPGPDSDAFDRVRSLLIASNADARTAAARAAAELGYEPVVEDRIVTGEAREAGALLARNASARHIVRPTCIISGGETTVTVRGNGRGGRNQEVALAAAIELEQRELTNVVVLSGGTDGVDGPTPAAGGVVSLESMRQARLRGLDPESALARNDSHTFLRSMGALVVTGPTHANVMDLQIVLVWPSSTAE